MRSDEGYLCMSRIDKMWTDRKYVYTLFYVIEEITWASNTGSHNLITCPKNRLLQILSYIVILDLLTKHT